MGLLNLFICSIRLICGPILIQHKNTPKNASLFGALRLIGTNSAAKLQKKTHMCKFLCVFLHLYNIYTIVNSNYNRGLLVLEDGEVNGFDELVVRVFVEDAVGFANSLCDVSLFLVAL